MADSDTRKLAGGMALLMTGGKMSALAMFGSGLKSLEEDWRSRNPDVKGFKDRWNRALEFYDATHQNQVNRALHTVGIPMIVGGAVGLLLSPRLTPPWLGSAGLFASGWVLNIAGHAIFEKNRPAFTEDPLSFVAGPAWDVKRMVEKVGGRLSAKKASRLAAQAAN